MVKIENLYKYYGDFLALDNVSFTVKKGSILGFLGPNGSGKTTTMRILSCFMPPSSGRVSIDGMDVLTHGHAIKKIIGYLPESPPLYYDMKVDEYLVYVAHLQGVPRNTIPSQLHAVKEKCGLFDVAHKLISTLSKGFKQRVGIAQSLINNPELLILDEPTIGLDPKQIKEIRNLIKSLAGESTVILSTHILSEVIPVCDDVLIINQGKIVFQESIQHITEHKTLEHIFLECTYGQEMNSDKGALGDA